MLPLRGKRVELLQSVQVNTPVISWGDLLKLGKVNDEVVMMKGNTESMFQEWAASLTALN